MSTFAISGNPSPFIIYGGSTNCCFTADWDLYLTATITTTITDLYFDPINNTCPISILEINGQTYSSPLSTAISLSFGQVIKLKISACPCAGVTPPTNVIYWGLTVAYTGILGSGTEDIFGVFQETNPVSAPYYPIDPSFGPLDLYPCITGTSNCNDLLTGTIPFTNHSNFEISVNINDYGNFPVGTKYYVDNVQYAIPVLIVPANTTVQIGFGFCWPNSTPTNFFIDVIICDIFVQKVTLNINPVYCLGCGINCLGFDIETESGLLTTVNAGCGYGLPNVYTEAAVGEYKTFVWHYTYNNGFINANIDIYFNPYLFTNIASIAPVDPYDLAIPTVGWHKKIFGYMVGTGPIPMQQVTLNQYQPNQQNWEVQIEIINTNEFKIYFSFYMMMDIDNGITNTFIENWKKLWFPNIYAATHSDFISFGNDVYKSDVNSPRYFAKDLMLIDNNVVDPTQPPKTPFRCFFYDSFPIAARWYNKGIGLTTSEFLTPYFYFYRNGNPWTANFSIFEKTYVIFKIDIPAAYTVTGMVAYIINVNEFDDTVDFKTNYDFSRAQIPTNPGSSVINNLIESPSIAPTMGAVSPSGGNWWQLEFTVGSANVVSTGQYEIGIIVYDDTNSIVNTFIYSDSTNALTTYIEVDTIPSEDSVCCPLNISTQWSDYINTYSNVYPHVTNYKQRLYNSINVSGGLFASNCLLGNFGYWQDWQKLIQYVKLNIYSKRLNANGTWSYFIYNQYQSLRDTSYPSDFNNLNSEFRVKNIGGGQLELSWFDRPRWESWVQFPTSQVYTSNPLTPYNLINIGPNNILVNTWSISYDWSKKLNTSDIGGEILFDYIIRFNLTNVVNRPNNAPFFVNKLIQQSLWVYPEEPLTTNTQFGAPFQTEFNPLILEGWDGSSYFMILGPICPNQYEHIKVTLTDSGAGLSGYVLGFFNKNPFGITTLKEDDTTDISPSGFTQLDSQYIYDVSPGVQTGTWEFKVDINSLPTGTYELCAQYLPT